MLRLDVNNRGFCLYFIRVDCKCNFKMMARMALRDLERYPATLCLIKDELDIQVYNLKKLGHFKL